MCRGRFVSKFLFVVRKIRIPFLEHLHSAHETLICDSRRHLGFKKSLKSCFIGVSEALYNRYCILRFVIVPGKAGSTFSLTAAAAGCFSCVCVLEVAFFSQSEKRPPRTEPSDWLINATSSPRLTALRAENAVPVVDCIGWSVVVSNREELSNDISFEASNDFLRVLIWHSV